MKSLHVLVTLAVLSLVVAVGSAFAGSTWSTPSTGPINLQKNLVISTSSPAAPTLATDGVDLGTLKTFNIRVETNLPAYDAGTGNTYDTSGSGDASTGGVNVLGSFTLLAYAYNPVALSWSRAPGLDITCDTDAGVPGLTKWSKLNVSVPNNVGRLAYVPSSGVGIPTKVYLVSVK